MFMKTDSHDTVRGIECLLHSVTMVDINVDIKNTRVVSKQLQNREYNVVHITESTGFCLFSVMESSCPIDCDITGAIVQPSGTLYNNGIKYKNVKSVARFPRSIEMQHLPIGEKSKEAKLTTYP